MAINILDRKKVKCPECGVMIDSLLCRSRQYTISDAILDRNGNLDWDPRDDVQESDYEEYECPECGEVLFTNGLDAERFLRGENASTD